ncbi:aldolase [Vararia minispora EC-137]|uniref:Aldolase n=1 Tax=Vararia minispora EC-137 TaxID=1314806 RepID=A0ACB8QZE0_9AGAM|nr:aldolase [Vararia minispora EC-137]
MTYWSTRPVLRAVPSTRSLATAVSPKEIVRIVEVGPRDGLQNEKAVIPPATKIELVNRLARAGSNIIEAGSFVSPKWVPQMAGTFEVMSKVEKTPGVIHQVLVPNMKGLEGVFSLHETHKGPRPVDEIAIFTAATDAFAKANTNCTVTESLARLAPVTRAALDRGLKVRGYVSVVITCPYSGKVDYKRVRDITRELFEMGCYEVSLGDTVGTGNPTSVGEMLETVMKTSLVDKLAAGDIFFHDTFGMGVANAMKAVEMGVRTLDSSVAGLGGCPYSPGATGNVATEDILYALQDTRFTAAGDLDALVDVGFWISEQLRRNNESRVAKAIRARRVREQSVKAKL